MSLFGCIREKEVSVLLGLGQWPHACPPDLRAHIAVCRSCSEIVEVKQAFQAARASAMSRAALPSASALWWRAQLRKRNEAIARISRPIFGAQIFALIVVAAAAIGGLVWQVRRGFDVGSWAGSFVESLRWSALWPASLPGFTGSLWFVLPLLAALGFVSGLVVYFASEK